ncbi:MAG: STAS domain-containing protein [Alphaproteobacteria bacterium]|nr:STAS domain-containing protein [Alphaproteobacteria bacterium]
MVVDVNSAARESVPIALARGVAVATTQGELTPETAARFRTELLDLLPKTRTTSVVIDLSSLEFMDGSEFEALLGIVRMAELMGADVVVSGIQPAIAAALVELDVDVDTVRTALTLDHALDLLGGAGTETTEMDAEIDPPEEPGRVERAGPAADHG